MSVVPKEQRYSWWLNWLIALTIDGRFDKHLDRLTELVNHGQCIVFEDDLAFIIMSPMKGNRLFIDFVYSQKPNAIVRLLPKLKELILVGGYEGAETIPHGKAQARLYRRHFTETKTGFYIDGRT